MLIEVRPETAEQLRAATTAACGDDAWRPNEGAVDAMTKRILCGEFGTAIIEVEKTTCSVLAGRGSLEACIRAGVPIQANVTWWPAP